ncbi:hypothetical protein C8F04DRAFT_914599, partial [Mycena alexandri]
RKYLVQMATDDEKAKRIDALQRDLCSSKNTAECLIQRYDFIRTVMDDTEIITHAPVPLPFDDLELHRWECGKTGGTKKGGGPQTKSSDLVCFGGSHEAFESEWPSPSIPGSRLGRKLRGNMTFSTRYDHDVPVRPPERQPKFWRSSPEPPTDGTAFDYCLANHEPIYILGWHISCYWPRNSGRPTIQVPDHSLNHILSNQLTISVDKSKPTRWHCKVTWVTQSSHNFPQL